MVHKSVVESNDIRGGFFLPCLDCITNPTAGAIVTGIINANNMVAARIEFYGANSEQSWKEIRCGALLSPSFQFRSEQQKSLVL